MGFFKIFSLCHIGTFARLRRIIGCAELRRAAQPADLRRPFYYMNIEQEEEFLQLLNFNQLNHCNNSNLTQLIKLSDKGLSELIQLSDKLKSSSVDLNNKKKPFAKTPEYFKLRREKQKEDIMSLKRKAEEIETGFNFSLPSFDVPRSELLLRCLEIIKGFKKSTVRLSPAIQFQAVIGEDIHTVQHDFIRYKEKLQLLETQKNELMEELEKERTSIHSLGFSPLTFQQHLDHHSNYIKLTLIHKALCPITNAIKFSDDAMLENILNEIFPPVVASSPAPAASSSSSLLVPLKNFFTICFKFNVIIIDIVLELNFLILLTKKVKSENYICD